MSTLQRCWHILARALAPPPRQFTCGDCERNAQCGLPPHDDCLHRIEQISRDDTYPQHPRSAALAVWPR